MFKFLSYIQCSLIVLSPINQAVAQKQIAPQLTLSSLTVFPLRVVFYICRKPACRQRGMLSRETEIRRNQRYRGGDFKFGSSVSDIYAESAAGAVLISSTSLFSDSIPLRTSRVYNTGKAVSSPTIPFRLLRSPPDFSFSECGA